MGVSKSDGEEDWPEKDLQGSQFYACPQSTNGLTKCASVKSLEIYTSTLYFLVYVIPQVYAYSREERRAHVGLESVLTKIKGALILVPLLASMGRNGQYNYHRHLSLDC